MPDEATPDLRPFLTKLIDRLLHIPKDPPPCPHCEHVTKHDVTLRMHNRLLFLVIGAVVTVIVRWAAGEISSRLSWEPPPPNPSERTTLERVPRPQQP